MTRHQYFRDSVGDNEHEYDMQGFARFHARLLGGNGISNTQNDSNIEPYDDFEVKATSGMDIELGSGYAAANGFMLEEDTPQTMTLDTSDPDHDRIDRVVLRFDTKPEEAAFYPTILKGKPDKNPTPPDLTKDNYTYDLYVAQIRVRADKASLDNDDITDERNINRLPIDNLQRGVRVDEDGTVSMPNQSFVKTRNNDEQIIRADATLGNPVKLKFGDIRYDTQNEVTGATTFTAKADGIYHFWIELAFKTSDVQVNGRINIYVFVNGSESFPLGTKTFVANRDRYMMVSGFDVLEKGDKVEFCLTAAGFADDVATDFTRARIIKTA